MTIHLTLTFNKDGTVDANLDKDIPPNALLLGLTTTLAGFIEETAHDDAEHNRAIDIVIAKLNRKKKAQENVPSKVVRTDSK